MYSSENQLKGQGILYKRSDHSRKNEEKISEVNKIRKKKSSFTSERFVSHRSALKQV